LGLPILTWAIFYRHLHFAPRLADLINAPILRLALGSFAKLGLRRASKGPIQMVAEDGRVPMIDIGALAKIRDGSIRVRGGIDRLTNDGVVFGDGKSEGFDAIVLATGFRPDLGRLIPDAGGVFDAHGMPRVTGGASDILGLYFCGQTVSPTGQLREIGREAERLASDIRQYLAARREAA
jgi:hypothetical protein